MVKVLHFAAWALLGMVLAFAGIPATNWRFWAIEACVIIIALSGMVIAWKT